MSCSLKAQILKWILLVVVVVEFLKVYPFNYKTQTLTLEKDTHVLYGYSWSIKHEKYTINMSYNKKNHDTCEHIIISNRETKLKCKKE